MKKTRTKILAGVILLAAALFITGLAWAKATTADVAGIMYVTPRVDHIPLREWIDDDGIWHVRGEIADYLFVGDLEGVGIGVVNINLNLSTGNGDESGCSISELTWGELEGTFEGHFSVTYTGGMGVGHGVYHGTGDFAGMRLMEDFTINLLDPDAPPYVVNFEGIILDPHGGQLPLTLMAEDLNRTPTTETDSVVILAKKGPGAVIAGNVQSKATKIPIAGELTVTVAGPPVRYWVDDEGIEHYRGLPAVYDIISGDLDGTGGSVVNVNIDPLTGNGDESGAATVDVTWGELSGTLEGRLSATYAYGISTGKAVYHGISGDFVGMKMMMSYLLDTTTGPPGTPWLVTYDAIVLDPHGE